MIISEKLQKIAPEAKDIWHLHEGQNPSYLNSVWLGFSSILAGFPGAALLAIWEFTKLLIGSIFWLVFTAITMILLLFTFVLANLVAGFRGKLVLITHEMALDEQQRHIAEELNKQNGTGS